MAITDELARRPHGTKARTCARQAGPRVCVARAPTRDIGLSEGMGRGRAPPPPPLFVCAVTFALVARK